MKILITLTAHGVDTHCHATSVTAAFEIIRAFEAGLSPALHPLHSKQTLMERRALARDMFTLNARWCIDVQSPAG
jgi:hypothetical protein